MEDRDLGQRGPKRGRPEMAFRTDPARQQVFLDALAETGSIIESARRCSPHSETGAVSTARSWMRDSPEFSAKVQESLDRFRDSLVRAAVTRGRDGYRRPVFQRGELVGHEQVYSDGLLLAELRRHFPSDYSEKHDHRHSVTIHPSGAWVISSDDLSYLSQDDRRTLGALMDRVRQGRGERQALEHQPETPTGALGETIDATFEEVDDAPEVWELAYEETGNA